MLTLTSFFNRTLAKPLRGISLQTIKAKLNLQSYVATPHKVSQLNEEAFRTGQY